MHQKNYFNRQKKRLVAFLEDFLAIKAKELASVKPWGPEVITGLGDFTGRGKMIRGGLVCLGWEMTGRRISRDPVRAGAALELVQSALLIHDDIMDRDTYRRGDLSLHQKYVLRGEKERLAEPGHFGDSMGICAGEIALFLAVEVMSSLAQPRARAKAALELFGREFVLVGLGQMKDLYAGASPESPAPRDVLDLYKLKTARYSFSLPLKLGCLLAGGKSLLGRKLEEVGEVFGLIFQLRDDDLGLFGNRAELGKPIGSDIKQGKKTLISILLRERAPARDAAKLSGIFGNPDASEGDIVFVRRLAEDLGVRSSVFQKIERYRRRAERLTKSLPADPKHIEILLDLLDFSLSRKK